MNIKISYIVTGIVMEGNEVKLLLNNQVVKEKPSAAGILGNIGGFIEQMKVEATKSRNPDTIHISSVEFNEMNINLGDTITINVE